MMFESSLLTQINVENPLPTLVEVEISRNLNAALKRAFHFFYLLAAEKVSALSPFIPYGDEMYLVLQTLFERFLLNNADTTFTELMFGLRRVRIVGPGKALHRPPSQGSSGGVARVKEALHALHFLAFGPPPMPLAEERAMNYVAASASAATSDTFGADGEVAAALALAADGVTGSAGAAPAVPAIEPDQLPGAALQLQHQQQQPALASGSDYNASELMSASRASYGYLKFAPITKQQRLLSLLLLTLKPYLEKKVKMWYANETDSSPDAVALREAYAYQNPSLAKLKKVFCTFVFPLLHVCQKSAEFTFKLLYLCELTPYTSPFHRLFNIAVKRGSFEESVNASPKAQRAITIARVLIFVVFFGFQLFEFSRSTGLGAGVLSDDGNEESSLPIPPPPVWGVDVKPKNKQTRAVRGHATTRDASAEGEEETQESTGGADAEVNNGAEEGVTREAAAEPVVTPGQCPVCGRPVTNAAVLTTSGILGCYPCLQQHLRENGCCPVTNVTTSAAQIRRVFEC